MVAFVCVVCRMHSNVYCNVSACSRGVTCSSGVVVNDHMIKLCIRYVVLCICKIHVVCNSCECVSVLWVCTCHNSGCM